MWEELVLFLEVREYSHLPNSCLEQILPMHCSIFQRGIPVVYYGDEVGMTGTNAGNDQFARQDMFATQVEIWKNEIRIGGSPIGDGDAFQATNTSPIARYLKQISELRRTNPGLANGVMQIRHSLNSLFVISKKDTVENREYLVAFNNSTKPIKTTITSATSTGGWKLLAGFKQACG